MDILDFIDSSDMDDLDYLNVYQDTVTRTRINPFEKFNNAEFRRRYRFSKEFGAKIVDLIKADLPSNTRGGTLSPQIQVACALRCWSSYQIQEDSADLHGISQQVVSKTCKNVATALAKKSHLFISMPSTLEDEAAAIRDFRRIASFSSVIGAIDCTHIRIKRVGGDISEAYVNRKGYYSLNVQVVCDADSKIRDIVAHWRGSAHDSRIFNESSIKERFENGEFHGKLLGDSGYACTPYLFTPLLNPTNEQEESYNHAHIRTRNTIERCFGLWKQRFRCLLRGMYMKLSTAKTTIVALGVLHNIAIDMRERTDFVQYHHQPQQRRRDIPPTVRGNIVRNNFISEHF